MPVLFPWQTFCTELIISKTGGITMKTDKKTKGIFVAAGIIIFIACVIFAAYAGADVGADIGEFIYNITR